jgi:DNA-binding NarL/FixJ family response regulator
MIVDWEVATIGRQKSRKDYRPAIPCVLIGPHPNSTIMPGAKLRIVRTTTQECPLSQRQLDVLRGLAGGKTYKEIAIQLGLAESSVRSHIHVAYSKLGVVDRAQAVVLAFTEGWI